MEEISKEIQDLEERIKCKRNRKNEVTEEVKQLNDTISDLDEIVNNATAIEVIVVEEKDYGLPNGLVDLKRDIVMKLIGIVQNVSKIQNIVGIGEVFFTWTKLRCFQFIRPLCRFFPKTPPNGFAYNKKKISGGVIGNGCTFLINFELPTGRIYSLDLVVKGEMALCLALKSLFPSLHNKHPWQTQGTCCVYTTCNLTVQSKWYQMDWGIDGSKDASVTLELDASQPAHTGTHTLRFFVDGKPAAVAIAGIPDGVCFAAYLEVKSQKKKKNLPLEFSSLEVKSFRNTSFCVTAADCERIQEYRW